MTVVGDPLSIVIPNYNRADALPETLASLARQTLSPNRFEVILVDDGSTDSSVELAETMRATLPFSVRVIEQQRQGPGAARNRGAQAACHDLLLFWDSDMVANGRTLQVHTTLHAGHNRALVAGARRPWQAACTSTFARVMHLGNLHGDHFVGKTPSFQEVLSSNLSIRSQDFRQLGGFDERLRAFEDTDLAYRAQQAGMSLLFTREAVGYHNHPMTLEQACRHQQHYQKHAIILFHKHPELEGQIQYLVDKGPLELGRDPPGLIARKLLRRLIASRGVLNSMRVGVTLLERHCPHPKVLTFLYWKILSSYQLFGYREGLSEYAEEMPL